MTPADPPPPARPSDVGTRISEAALTILVERGLGALSMRAIADTAGIARQTLYNHYSDVDSILTAAITAHEAADQAELAAILDTYTSPGQQLEHLVRHRIAIAARHGTMPDLKDLLPPRPNSDPDTELLAGLLTDGITNNEFRRDIEPERDAVLLRHLIKGATELAAADPNQAQDITRTTLNTIRAATRPSPNAD